MFWTGRAQEWLFDHGFMLDQDEVVLIPKSKWRTLQYTDRSIRHPELKTMCVPTDYGMALLFEGRHFRIVEG